MLDRTDGRRRAPGRVSALPDPAPGPRPTLDAEGRYHARGGLSVAVIATYFVLLLAVLFVLLPREAPSYRWVSYLLAALLLLMLARYLTVRYSIDDTTLVAARLLGGRRVPLDEVRRIEYASLRELSPTGALGGVRALGWRGRMWSPVVGWFDTVFSDAARGLLVTAEELPLYISPRDVDAFARELSRRVRSYTGPLAVDVGHPGPADAP